MGTAARLERLTATISGLMISSAYPGRDRCDGISRRSL
jgi:hypothetical protein